MISNLRAKNYYNDTRQTGTSYLSTVSYLRIDSIDNMNYFPCSYSGYEGESNSSAASGDFYSAVPQILQNLDSIRTSHKQVLQAWSHKKMKLDQCFQLRLFEQDCDKVSRCYSALYFYH